MTPLQREIWNGPEKTGEERARREREAQNPVTQKTYKGV